MNDVILAVHARAAINDPTTTPEEREGAQTVLDLIARVRKLDLENDNLRRENTRLLAQAFAMGHEPATSHREAP